MRVTEPERVAQLEESKGLWKFLGAEWQKTKLDDVAFRFYTDEANQESNGFGQVGTEESKEETKKVPQTWNEFKHQWLRDNYVKEEVVEVETHEDHVEVEKVLAHWAHWSGAPLRYLIKFVGTKDPEWVDGEHCACDDLIEEYWETKNSSVNKLPSY